MHSFILLYFTLFAVQPLNHSVIAKHLQYRNKMLLKSRIILKDNLTSQVKFWHKLGALKNILDVKTEVFYPEHSINLCSKTNLIRNVFHPSTQSDNYNSSGT